MKCPHCHKEITVSRRSNDKVRDFLWFLPINMLTYCIVTAFILTQVNYYFAIPWNIKNGASLNYDSLIILIVALFVTVYDVLYVNNKVKGKLFLFR